jgi:hypothetical protein
VVAVVVVVFVFRDANDVISRLGRLGRFRSIFCNHRFWSSPVLPHPPSLLLIKVITSVSAGDFKSWADAGFPPEASFLEALGSIDGIHTIETQTYTIMPV